MLLTTEGVLGEKQMVMIPRNLFDLNLVANMVAHEILDVRQKYQEVLVEDQMKENSRSIMKCFSIKNFHLFPMFQIFHKKFFGEKALEYYKRMGENSDLQEKYSEDKIKVEDLIAAV